MTTTCDLLVIGAGLAGWTAALRATEQGIDVLVIEKSPGEYGNGNTLMASGSYRAAGVSPQSAPSELYARAMAEGVAYPDLVTTWSETCPGSVDWLRSHDIEVSMVNGRWPFLEQDSPISYAPLYRKEVGTNILKKLKAEFLKQGGQYSPAFEALRLLVKEPFSVSGVVGRSQQTFVELQSNATILATGGFSANKEMLVRYVGRHADECKLRGSSSDTGDGLRMALEIGAKAVNLSYFYGHLLSLKALSDDRFWPYPRVDSLLSEGVLVNRNGLRFLDEGRGDVAAANDLARTDDVKGACLLFDEEAWENAKTPTEPINPTLPAANPWLMENDGNLYKCKTLQELAEVLSLDYVNVKTTIECFDRGSEKGRIEGVAVQRTGKTRPLRAPFYGLRVVPGITFTMGGVLINGQAQVLDLQEQPIKGLYGAGDAIGGLMGGYRGGYMGGLSQAVVTGLLAGENSSAFVKQSRG